MALNKPFERSPKWFSSDVMSYLITEINYLDKDDKIEKYNFWSDHIKRIADYKANNEREIELTIKEIYLFSEYQSEEPLCLQDVLYEMISNRILIQSKNCELPKQPDTVNINILNYSNQNNNENSFLTPRKIIRSATNWITHYSPFKLSPFASQSNKSRANIDKSSLTKLNKKLLLIHSDTIIECAKSLIDELSATKSAQQNHGCLTLEQCFNLGRQITHNAHQWSEKSISLLLNQALRDGICKELPPPNFFNQTSKNDEFNMENNLSLSTSRVFKFSKPSPHSIPSTEYTLAVIDSTLSSLQTRINRLQTESDHYLKDAKLCLSLNRKQNALLKFKHHKRLNSTINQLQSQSDSLLLIHHQLNEINEQNLLINCMEKAAAVLKSVNDNLSLDRVDTMVANLSDQMNQIQITDKTLTQLTSNNQSINQSAEAELEEMIKKMNLNSSEIQENLPELKSISVEQNNHQHHQIESVVIPPDQELEKKIIVT